MITIEYLKEILEYNPYTGKWIWLKKISRKIIIGLEAGCYDSTNHYVLIGICGKIYTSHRLAWFYMTGEWPKEVDHKDTDGWNNKWNNLRLATRLQNCRNTKPRVGRTLPKGVLLTPNKKRFIARIIVEGKQIGLGRYDSADQASQAYKNAALKYFGEYARS